MSKKTKKNHRKNYKWIICFLTSLPLTFVLIKILENKNETLFWTYMGIGGLSALIMRWIGNTDEKSKFFEIVEYLALTFAITLFSWGIWNHFFNE